MHQHTPARSSHFDGFQNYVCICMCIYIHITIGNIQICQCECLLSVSADVVVCLYVYLYLYSAYTYSSTGPLISLRSHIYLFAALRTATSTDCSKARAQGDHQVVSTDDIQSEDDLRATVLRDSTVPYLRNIP